MIIPLTLIAALSAPALVETDDVPSRAFQVLKTYCHGCHGKDGEDEGGLDYVLDRDQLIRKNKVVAGRPDKSLLVKRLTAARKPMPPLDDDRVKGRPSRAEVASVVAWVEAGAPAFPVETGRTEPPHRDSRPVENGHRAILEAIDAELKSFQPEKARRRRYFSLASARAGAANSESDLRLMQAGVSKLLNSLSWRRNVVTPRLLLGGSLMAIDLADLDWDATRAWDKILGVYPYGLKFDGAGAPRGMAILAGRVYAATGTELPVVRADWFLATASQPGQGFTGQVPYKDRAPASGRPLYESLLNLPDDARILESKLNVDLKDHFDLDKLARAGFTKSGVSNQNRIIERHDSSLGAYWISWDFKTDEGRQRIARFPLGPVELAGARFANHAFEHDGGEIIFHLPNGLQGYMLINAKGAAIPEGPPDVVRDKDETAGRNTLIVNGLSCIACHARGLKRDFQEGVREGNVVGGEALDKVLRIYPPRDELDRLMREDDVLFARGMKAACGPYLLVGPDAGKDVVLDFPEPVSAFAKPFLREKLTLDDGARELGVDPRTLAAAVRASERLRLLRPWLTPGATISRKAWESQEDLISLFQQAADVLELGQPKLVRSR